MLAAATAGLLVACEKPAPPPAGPNVVSIVATDYAYALPDTVPAGRTRFSLVNQGAEPHHAILVRIAEEHPLPEVLAALEAPTPPAWLTLVAAPNTAFPGDSSNTTTNLTPGTYVLTCLIRSPDGKTHAEKGMIRQFHVLGPAPADTPEPEADFVITLKDYDYELSAPLTAGAHTIRVVNAGPQAHEVGIERLDDGKTAADYQAWVAGGMQGPPPSRPLGGVIGPQPGGSAGTFTVALTPGRYVLTCYVPDASDGRPHVAHGMVKEIVIN